VKLEINPSHVDRSPRLGPAHELIMTPPIGEDYWAYRVAVSDNQAVIGFKKFGMIGIGFQYEEDWNTNLPSSSQAEEIYEHIKHNSLGAPKDECIAAIKLIQEAVRS
jgi:hypothetical protein